MKKILVANWKLHPAGAAEAVKIAKGIDKEGVVICPPFVFLPEIKKNLKRAKLGAQDSFWEERGPYTGEISPSMLKKSGAEYVILGHSERRGWLGETDEIINKKVLTALWAGLKIVLCVGERLSVSKRGLSATKNFVKNQLFKDLKGLPRTEKLIIAYEPIWAIGTGRSDNPEEAGEIARFIKNILRSKFHILSPRVLYGGSANSKNAKKILKLKEIDGILFGGASLKINEFKKIIKVAEKIKK